MMMMVKYAKGEPVVTPKGNGYVLQGCSPGWDRVTVRMNQGGDECDFYPADLKPLPEYREANPKIDRFKDGRYVSSTNWHRTISRCALWDGAGFAYRIDHR